VIKEGSYASVENELTGMELENLFRGIELFNLKDDNVGLLGEN